MNNNNEPFLPPSVEITEARLQSDCFQWFHNSLPHLRGLLYHVPNGGTRNPVEALKLKAMGVVPGIPDMIFHYKGGTYFFEFKNANGKGVLSIEQRKIHNALELQKFEVWVIESLLEFKRLIGEILARDKFENETLLSKDDFFYRHRVFEYLYNSLNAAEVTDLAVICNEDTLPMFCRYVTEFIEGGYGNVEGWEILFTPNYQGIYKKVLGSDQDVFLNGSSII